jgi:3-isopropylmalate/(R)-2-methylmalate dehydratase small subunit
MLSVGEIEQLWLRQRAAGTPYYLTVDLEAQRVEDGHGFFATFPFDAFRREALLKGLDEIGRTLLEEARISAYEARQTSGGGE